NVVGILTFIDDVFGFPFNLWLGHNYHYITKDPQEVKTILHNISAQNKGFTYQDISYVFQNSLLTIHSTSIALDKKPTNMHRFGECLMEFQSDVARKLLNPLIPASLWLRFQAGGKIVARKVKELRSISFVANEETPALLDLMMSLKGGILSDEDIFDDLMFLSSAVRHKIIPKGANVVLSLFHLHRSEKYWEDPQKFDPDRFLPENISKITPYSYLPFSSGPRDCLGMKICLQKKYVTKISGPLYEASKFHPSTNPLTNLS
ncbi:hypothetical protein D910_03734, partial [Dendroctonus ponderosae]